MLVVTIFIASAACPPFEPMSTDPRRNVPVERAPMEEYIFDQAVHCKVDKTELPVKIDLYIYILGKPMMDFPDVCR